MSIRVGQSVPDIAFETYDPVAGDFAKLGKEHVASHGYATNRTLAVPDPTGVVLSLGQSVSSEALPLM